MTWQLWVVVGVLALIGLSVVVSVDGGEGSTTSYTATAVVALNAILIVLILTGA